MALLAIMQSTTVLVDNNTAMGSCTPNFSIIVQRFGHQPADVEALKASLSAPTMWRKSLRQERLGQRPPPKKKKKKKRGGEENWMNELDVNLVHRYPLFLHMFIALPVPLPLPLQRAKVHVTYEPLFCYSMNEGIYYSK